MAITEQDIVGFIHQMPLEMRNETIKYLETLRGVKIEGYKERQIKAAEAVIDDVKTNPDNYTSLSIGNKFMELLGGFDIPRDLKDRVSLAQMFISYRTTVELWEDDSNTEERKKVTFDEFVEDMKQKNAKTRRKKNDGIF